MNATLIDGIYSLYLKHSKKGELYEVPVKFSSHENGSEDNEDIVLHVWATSEEEAEERAAKQAQAMERKKTRTTQEKSLGLILPASHYNPKKVTSAWKLWKDPCYQKAKDNMFAPSGYTAGTMIKLSIASLLNQKQDNNEEKKHNIQFLTKAYKVNIICFFIWISLLLIGVLFSILGIQHFDSGKFFLKWVNPYVVASFISLFIGIINIIKTYRDHKTIVKSIGELSQKTDSEDKIEDGNGL